MEPSEQLQKYRTERSALSAAFILAATSSYFVGRYDRTKSSLEEAYLNAVSTALIWYLDHSKKTFSWTHDLYNLMAACLNAVPIVAPAGPLPAYCTRTQCLVDLMRPLASALVMRNLGQARVLFYQVLSNVIALTQELARRYLPPEDIQSAQAAAARFFQDKKNEEKWAPK